MSALPTMLPETASALTPKPDLLRATLDYLHTTGRANRSYLTGARSFYVRWPDPAIWARLPLSARLLTTPDMRPTVTFLMLHGHLRPGYDYLLARKFPSLLRDLPLSPLGPAVARFWKAARELGYSSRKRVDLVAHVVARLLIQTGQPLGDLTEGDFKAFEAAINEREAIDGRSLTAYRGYLHTARTVIYHLGGTTEPRLKSDWRLRWSWEAYLEGVQLPIRTLMLNYLECCLGTRKRATVAHLASRLGHFGRHLASVDPDVVSFAQLDRQRHVESYLKALMCARHRRTGELLSVQERRSRILALNRMLQDIAEWGWPEAPNRRVVFARDAPRLPRTLPRYLPPDADRRLTQSLGCAGNRLRADALLLARATGLRVGELVDLELDCVHEAPGLGAWLKVPLGKFDTERMVPLDEETLDVVDRIVANRSPGRPLRHPRSGRMVDFLLVYQGRRVSTTALRDELAQAAGRAGLGRVTPHQLRHTYATALVNAGVSLQALMALLGHQTAEMSLRYGHLFDATVRADYERALTLAKERLGPVLPSAQTPAITGNWRQLPLIKSRLAGGYCLRTAAQGVCPYTNICEHCPNFRTESTFLPILATQRADSEALARDAEARGWGEEATRHRGLVERLDLLMSRASGQ